MISHGRTAKPITQESGNDTLITVVYRSSGQVFGKMRTGWSFNTEWLHSSMYSRISVTDSIGYTYGQWEPGYNEYCLGAIIDGIQYGTLTRVPSPDLLLPERCSLSQNYPDPFNPSTSIRFWLPRGMAVTLRVYDILGREVTTLVDEVMAPGSYTIGWGTRDETSGVYFYRIVAGNYKETRKMLLIR